MSEAELQKAVIECARLFGWRVAHFRPARTAHGWATPVEADGKGFPDLVLVRGQMLLFVELKSETGKLTPEQQDWVEALRGPASVSPAIVGLLWRPSNWANGDIERALR